MNARRWPTLMVLLCTAATVAAPAGSSAPAGPPAQPASAGLPSRFESHLSAFLRISATERRRLLEGTPVSRLLEGDASKEVNVLGAVWIAAPIERYVAALKDIETFERGGRIKVTRRISDPPRLEDFADLRLPAGDVADLRQCRVGDCDVKLSEQPLQRLRTEVDWRVNPQAAGDAFMQRLALEYVTAYLEGGNQRLPVYRDRSRPTLVGQEMRSMVEQIPLLVKDMPNLGRYLLDYPKASLPNATSFLYWQETQFGLKPTIRISHLTISEGEQETVVASKMLYATHYFWTALELRVLVPDPARGPGFWFLMNNRSRSDGLSGFTGLFVRGRVRRDVQEGTLTALRQTKSRLEGAR